MDDRFVRDGAGLLGDGSRAGGGAESPLVRDVIVCFFKKNMIGAYHDGVNLCLMMNERNLVANAKAME